MELSNPELCSDLHNVAGEQQNLVVADGEEERVIDDQGQGSSEQIPKGYKNSML